jgi:hypothetical protein
MSRLFDYDYAAARRADAEEPVERDLRYDLGDGPWVDVRAQAEVAA